MWSSDTACPPPLENKTMANVPPSYKPPSPRDSGAAKWYIAFFCVGLAGMGGMWLAGARHATVAFYIGTAVWLIGVVVMVGVQGVSACQSGQNRTSR